MKNPIAKIWWILLPVISRKYERKGTCWQIEEWVTSELVYTSQLNGMGKCDHESSGTERFMAEQSTSSSYIQHVIDDTWFNYWRHESRQSLLIKHLQWRYKRPHERTISSYNSGHCTQDIDKHTRRKFDRDRRSRSADSWSKILFSYFFLLRYLLQDCLFCFPPWWNFGILCS